MIIDFMAARKAAIKAEEKENEIWIDKDPATVVIIAGLILFLFIL